MNHSQEPPAPPSPSGPGYPPAAPYPSSAGSPVEYGPSAEGAGWLSAMPRPRRRPWRRTVAVGALTGLVVAALGVPFGLLWSWLSPSVPVVRTARADVVVRDPSPEQFVAADAWFTMLGVGFGVLVAVAAWLLLRRDRGPALLLGVVLGALAAAAAAWQVGRRIGLGGYETWRAAANAGDTFDRPPDLHTYGALLVPAFAAVIVCTLLAGWSNDPDLDLPGAHPGYGRDLSPGGDDQVSWDSPGGPGPTTAPAPPAPGSATPPPG